MLAEKSETNQINGIDHIQRPGMVVFAEAGAGPIRFVFRQAGTFLGDFLVISGGELYRITESGSETLIGAFSGAEPVTMAASATRAIWDSDGQGLSTNGTTLSSIIMPDGRLVGSVAHLNGYFLLSEKNSARFYWIEPGQTDPDGLSFATTESTPGFIVKIERVGDELWFFKEEGIEVWVPTGDADLPFQRLPGRNYDRGCRSRNTVCRFDNSVAWVGNDGLVYRGDSSHVRISDHSLEEQIRKSLPASLRAWSFDFDGHRLYCLTLGSGTYVYDISSQAWSEFASYNRNVWRCQVGDMGATFVVAGDDELPLLYRLDPQVSNDNGEVMVRQLTGGIPVRGAAVRCDSIDLYATTGTEVDPNVTPHIRISWSDDLYTFGDWVDVSLGKQGHYSEPVRVNRLGRMARPGRLFNLTVTDDVVVTISALLVNEPSR